jgi:acetyl esterase
MARDELGAWKTLRTSVERSVVNGIVGVGWARTFLGRTRKEPVDGRTLSRDVAAVLGLDDIDDRSDLRGLSPEKARVRVAESIRVVDAEAPPGVTREDREIPGPVAAIPVRLYAPANLDPSVLTPCVVYFHGGGWVTGSISTHDGLCSRIALGAACRVVSVEYRLAPEHRCPAAVEDCLAATRWVLAHAEELGVDPRRVAVAGDSAGGNLSAVVSRETSSDVRRPALQVLLYPALDATFSLPSHRTFAERYFLTAGMCAWYYDHYLGGQDPKGPAASPLLAPDVSNVPALVYTSGFDPLRDEGKAYADRLRAAGTPVTYREFADTVHGFALMTGALQSGRDATNEVIGQIGVSLGG